MAEDNHTTQHQPIKIKLSAATKLVTEYHRLKLQSGKPMGAADSDYVKGLRFALDTLELPY
jgi:hypothetical protein